MGNFFSSGTVDTNSFTREKLPTGVYKCSAVDFVNFYGAPKGDRTQLDFIVVAGCVDKGTKGTHQVMHKADAAWKIAKARGEMAAMLGALFGFNRDTSGLKVTGDFFAATTRDVQQDSETGKVISRTRNAEDLPILGKEFLLVVKPYFDKRTGNRKTAPKTGQASVVYEIFPLSSGYEVTTKRNVVADRAKHVDDLAKSAEDLTDASEDDGEIPGAPENDAEPTSGAMDRATAAGWRPNPNAPGFYYAKGEAKQLKLDALLAKFAA